MNTPSATQPTEQTPEEILAELSEKPNIRSGVDEATFGVARVQARTARILEASVKELTVALNRNSEKSERLAASIRSWTIVLTFLTALLALLTILDLARR